MAESGIPREVRRFVVRYIDSVGQLEALLLLRSVGEPWRGAEIAQRLYAGEAETIVMLDQLCRVGLLTCSDKSYKYECRTEELRRMVDRLAELYGSKLIPITNLIHGKSRRIREFADAFRLRKDS